MPSIFLEINKDSCIVTHFKPALVAEMPPVCVFCKHKIQKNQSGQIF